MGCGPGYDAGPALAGGPRRAAGGVLPPGDARRGALPRRGRDRLAGEPADFPAWDRVYAFFRRWRDTGLLAEFHDRLRDRVRQAAGRDTEPSAGVIDAQSVKGAASVSAASRGFDGGKKINGRKRHIVVDASDSC